MVIRIKLKNESEIETIATYYKVENNCLIVYYIGDILYTIPLYNLSYVENIKGD